MNRRLLIPRAGSPACNNLIRSLKAGDPELFIVGCNDDRFVLKKSTADRNYLFPAPSRREFQRALRQTIKAERIDLVIPNSDADVSAISRLRDRLPCRTFLPRKSVLERCQDKYRLTTFLHRRGFPTPLTYPVKTLDQIENLFRRLSSHSQLWCRAREGSGSLAALPVESPEQARAWIEYWEQMRGIPKGSFTLSEYLPGRDFTVQGLFKSGTLIMAKMHERLSYHTLGPTPSGVSSTAAVAKMTFEPAVMRLSIKAILALDAKASGVFFVDLKQNVKGKPCITEINAGRFANVPTIHDTTSHENMALAYVRAALDERVEIIEPRGYEEECYVMRGIDALPTVLQASELFADIEDAR